MLEEFKKFILEQLEEEQNFKYRRQAIVDDYESVLMHIDHFEKTHNPNPALVCRGQQDSTGLQSESE